jgi:hypothetical protein
MLMSPPWPVPVEAVPAEPTPPPAVPPLLVFDDAPEAVSPPAAQWTLPAASPNEAIAPRSR